MPEKGFVLQANGGLPVIVPEEWLHRDVPLKVLTTELAGQGLTIPSDEVETWAPRNAHEVTFQGRGEGLKIVSLEGVRELDKLLGLRTYSAIVGTRGARPKYPQREWEIDNLKNLSMRMMRMLAPIGPGSQAFLVGPWGSGKTWTARSLVEALLSLASTLGKMAFVVFQVGERTTDVPKMEEIITRYPGVPVWHFVAVLGEDGPIARVNIADFCLERVKRLYEFGWDVIYVVDSLPALSSKVYDTDPRAPKQEKARTGGISPYAQERVSHHTSVAGCAADGRGSVTGIYTALVGGEKSRTSDSTLFETMGGPQSSTVVTHGEFAGPYPRFAIGGKSTFTREISDMLGSSGGRLEIYEEIQRRIETMKPYEALPYVRDLANETIDLTWEGAIAVWRKMWAEEAARADRFETLDSFRLVVNAATPLSRIRDTQQAVQAVLAMLKSAWQLDRPETVKRLLQGLQEPEIAILVSHLADLGLIKEAPPAKRLTSAALDLRGDSKLLEAFREALEIAGVNPDTLVSESFVPPEPDRTGLMVMISKLLKADGQKSFGSEVARRLAEETDISALSILDLLRSGKSPKQIIGEK